MKKKYEFEIELATVWDGYPDFYSGHGHFGCSKDLVACLPIHFPINYGETVREILDNIIEAFNSGDYIEFLTDDEEEQDAIREWLTEEVIEQCFKDALEPGTKMEERFFKEDIEPIPEGEFEYPVLILHFHIWRAEGNTVSGKGGEIE